MGVAWTPEQEKVIKLRNRDILVSAAAGSGKTAVLVERIITMITEGEHPVDIDKLLIVTFTNAAAAEMRERIGRAIEKKMEEDPENGHIQRQLTLIHNAQITTIHSFCLYIIRNYFHKIDLDPNFRLGDEGELELLKNDILDEMLEEKYQEEQKEFLNFVDAYGADKSDEGIKELILSLHRFSMSYPWPVEWLNNCKAGYGKNTLEEFEESIFSRRLVENVKNELGAVSELLKTTEHLCCQSDGPYMYEEAVKSDIEQIKYAVKSDGYQEAEQAIRNIKYTRLSSKKDQSVDDNIKEMVKGLRNQAKKMIENIKKQYFYQKPEDMLMELNKSQKYVDQLIDLTITFSIRFHDLKQEKNLLDFNDLEHLALKILVDEETEKPTETAGELSENYFEILVDEYQDSNLVQEYLLSAVTKKEKGIHNYFMVGDVKQSIYRFRLARPELFMEKYERFSLEDSLEQKILLDKNFRSRKEVIDGINFIFYQIMKKEIGNIKYNDETALYTGAKYLESLDNKANQTEVMLIDTKQEDEEDLLEELGSDIELEARMVAKRIKELIHPETGMDVINEAGDGFRKAGYQDIVILLRTVSNWADTFANVFSREGIPAHTTSATGYFSTIEVQTVLNLLRIIDNPLQEIPLTAVLVSPIVGLTTQEIAKLKIDHKEDKIYEAFFKECQGDGEETKRLRIFYHMLEDFREKVSYTPIHELLQYVLDKTEYKNFILGMPGGIQKHANIEMLLEKAIAFESTSYKGLFHFVRYIEQLHKYDVDFGEANILDENEDTVRIMSIHKSKGLEFPIVFVAGMGKKFNEQDSKAKVVLHSELGVGIDYIDLEKRIKSPTLLKKIISKEITLENLGEELRVLYVALTRAKEKLILSGVVKKLPDFLEKKYHVTEDENIDLSYDILSLAKSYYDWVIPALMRHKSFGSVYQQIDGKIDMIPAMSHPMYTHEGMFDIQIIRLGEFVHEEIKEQVSTLIARQEFLEEVKNVSKEQMEKIDSILGFEYPYEKEQNIYTKISVTELKKKTIEQQYTKPLEQDEPIIEVPVLEEIEEVDEEAVIPKFIKKSEEKVTGAQRGSAYHRVMECIAFEKIAGIEDVKEQLDTMLDNRKIDMLTREMVSPYAVLEFFKTNLGKRMAEAESNGKLYKEQPFVMGIKAREIEKDMDSDELVLVQGIIDAYFIENNEIILMDYKTDHVKNKEELVKKYKVQLDLYEKAIQKATGKIVKERIICSFGLKEEIKI